MVGPHGPARRVTKGGPLGRVEGNLDGQVCACCSTTKVRDNPGKCRFKLDLCGQVVFACYARYGSTLVIPHVEAPPPLRGTGAASQLMAGVMEIARTEGLKVRPLCSYASVWMRRLREYHDLLG
jgi:uncharacterized protein